MESAHRHALRRALIALDALAILVAMITAMALHGQLREHLEGFKAPPAFQSYLLLAYLTLPMWLSIAAVLGLYRQFERTASARALLRDLVQLHVFGLLGLTLLIYLTQVYMNRSVVVLYLAMTFTLMFLSRLVLHLWLRREHRLGHWQERLLLVADCQQSIDAVRSALAGQNFGPSLVGSLRPSTVETDASEWSVPPLGTTAMIQRVLHETSVDAVLVSCRRDVVIDIPGLLRACDEVGIPLRCQVHVDHRDTHLARVGTEGGIPCLIFESKHKSADALIVKRCIDFLFAAACLLLASPLLALISAAILLTMGRPVLVRQLRSGYNGRTFTMYKFRSMVRDASDRKDALEPYNELGGPAFKMRSDPRITRLGRILRRSSLDELPQLFNVLIGRMSLVGPRPLIVGEQQRISGSQRRRLSMKPGMTGLWQVSGRSDLGFEDWMQLDLEYVDNWSLWLDLKLLARTIPAVLTGRGAR